ncbi:MAG: hypothetical protein QOJ63_176 [Solirubrobacteraceae bacterium]|nr:hypothetical protein [Solirubrobacteraceae bacterium]
MPYPTSPARFLAPIALLAAALAIVLVLSSAMSDSNTISASPTTTETVAHKPVAKSRHKSYVVKAGDTLSGIAAKTGVSLETIQTLNDSVDAQALHAGQRIKLAP